MNGDYIIRVLQNLIKQRCHIKCKSTVNTMEKESCYGTGQVWGFVRIPLQIGTQSWYIQLPRGFFKRRFHCQVLVYIVALYGVCPEEQNCRKEAGEERPITWGHLIPSWTEHIMHYITIKVNAHAFMPSLGLPSKVIIALCKPHGRIWIMNDV